MAIDEIREFDLHGMRVKVVPEGSIVLTAAQVEQVREDAKREAIQGILSLVVANKIAMRGNGYGVWLVPPERFGVSAISTHEITVDEVLALLGEQTT